MRFKNLLYVGLLATVITVCDNVKNVNIEVPKRIIERDNYSRDEPPNPSFLFPLLSENLENFKNKREITLTLPRYLSIVDDSGDSKYDIIRVVATRKEIGSELEVEFFRTGWKESQSFLGRDIKRIPLNILFSNEYFDSGKKYEITVTATDSKRRSGSFESRIIVE